MLSPDEEPSLVLKEVPELPDDGQLANVLLVDDELPALVPVLHPCVREVVK